jgi:hypothetical protein
LRFFLPDLYATEPFLAYDIKSLEMDVSISKRNGVVIVVDATHEEEEDDDDDYDYEGL